MPFGSPLRVVQITDIHAGIYMNRRQMRRYADRVNALRPDLFVLTGDFISNSLAFLPGCLAEMARVHARCGIFATLGNHEHWYANIDELTGRTEAAFSFSARVPSETPLGNGYRSGRAFFETRRTEEND